MATIAPGQNDALCQVTLEDRIASTMRSTCGSTASRSYDVAKPAASDQAVTPAGISAAAVREPDLVVQQTASGWTIALNRSALPALRVEAAGNGTAAGLAAAKSLERMVEARNTTVLMVGREILQRQQDAMQHGPAALAPMTMATSVCGKSSLSSSISMARFTSALTSDT